MGGNRLKGFLAIAGLAVAVVVLLLTGWNPGGQAGNAPAGTAQSTNSAQAPASTPAPASPQSQATASKDVPPGRSTSSNTSGLPEIKASQLPAEARQTLELIASGGPYPYSRDGVTFGNRERILPRKPSGFYKEYTVRTPGEQDRGARRIIAGNDGGKFYTADHYASFMFIVEGK